MSGKSGEEVETFLLEQLDDAPTEVMDIGMGAQREVAPLEDVSEESFPTAPQWHYGRCVALKLVAHSPYGSSAFEQLLSVLLTVFEVSPEERKGSFNSRKTSQSWWRSSLSRCTQPTSRGAGIPENDALLPCPMGKKKTLERNGDDELQIGDSVEIFGLQGAKDLNGRTGRIVSFVEETQRFGVKLDDGLENKAVKPANLRRVDQDGASERAVLEAQLAQVVQQLKTAEEEGEDKTLYQKMLAELVRKLKDIDLANEARAKQRAAAAASAAKVKVEKVERPVMGPKPQ
eukprot:symbB.v1.2.025402.t1/scaffold2455.1/size78842/1